LGLVLLFSVTVSDLTYIGCARSGKTENGAREKDSISGATDGVTTNFAFGFHSGTVPFSVFPNFTRRSSRENFCSHLTVLNRLGDRNGNNSAKHNHCQTANDVTKDCFHYFFLSLSPSGISEPKFPKNLHLRGKILPKPDLELLLKSVLLHRLAL